MEEVNTTKVSLNTQESNINNTDHGVKHEVSKVSANQIYMKWEENQTVLKQHKDRIRVLLEDNRRQLSMITTLKMEVKEVSCNAPNLR